MVSGWLILNKPFGLSSTQAGSKVKRALGEKKLGHAGTLDPYATGVLPLALGEATKTIPYCVMTDKIYEFQITWGESRTTDDAEGEVLETSSYRPSQAEILEYLPEFCGKIMQIPPVYSAIKQGGKRAYALAREGKDPNLQPRLVEIYSLKLLHIDSKDAATFRMHCGKGTYVRAVARDLGEKLGAKGYVSVLTRVKVGKFSLNDAISLENFLKIEDKEGREKCLLPVGSVLDDIPAVTVSEAKAQKLRQGLPIMGDLPSQYPISVWVDDRLVALAEVKDGWIHPRKVFNL